jgi:signal transduction histidine kinase
VPKLGQRLIDDEAHACLGRVLARGLPALQALLANLQELEQQLVPGAVAPPLPAHQKLALLRASLETVFGDFAHFWSDPPGAWDQIDLTPGLERAWRLIALGLAPEVRQHLELAPLPPIRGVATELSLATLYLLDFVIDLLPTTGDLGLTAGPTPAGGVRLTVWGSGEPCSPAECQKWLNPFGDPEGVRGSLGPALAAAIAAQHGGSLSLEPRDVGGVVFFLELPPPAVF